MRLMIVEHIIRNFGYEFTATYEEIAEKVGYGVNFNTIRRLLIDLEKAGAVTIIKEHYRRRTYHFDKAKVEHILTAKTL